MEGLFSDNMDYGYSFLMFSFAAVLLLYALLLAVSKDTGMIPRSGAARIKNKKEYAVRFAKVIAVTALAPLTSGLIALSGNVLWAMAMLILGFIICIREGVKYMQTSIPESEKQQKADKGDD